jgi:hypothetical protein
MFERLKVLIAVKYLIRIFLITLVFGILTQIVGILLLSNSVKVQQGNIKSSWIISNAADFFLTASSYSPPIVILDTIAGETKAMRLIKIADISAQLLKQSHSVISDFSTSDNINDFLRNYRGAEQIQKTSMIASPMISLINNLVQGSDDEESIDRVLGKSLKNPIRVLMALGELGRHAEVLSGCEKEIKFLVLLTSSAEARTIGGLIGQYMTVVSNCGELEIERVGTNTDLKNNAELDKSFKEFPGLYQSANPEWVNSNLLPDGGQVSQSWIRSYQEQFNETVDGVIVLDTLLLSEFAAIQGGLTSADGVKLETAAKIDAYLRNGIYFQFPENQILRKEHLLDITEQLAKSLDFSSLTKNGMLPVLMTALGRDRILLSLNSTLYTQKGLERLSWSNKDRSTVFIGVNNLSGSKFDFYSNYSVEVSKCSNFNYLITFRVKNFASEDAQYPDYVARRLDNYHLDKIGVLNQFLFSYEKNTVRVTAESTPAFSDYKVMLGESNRDLISIVEFIEAQEFYEFSIQLQSRERLNFRMWGQEIKVSKSRNVVCSLN